VLRKTWNVDWGRVHALDRDATFNVYDFTAHELKQIGPRDMDDRWLLACVSLPFWFPPQVIDGHVYIDSVYATDSNLLSAIERGADELWVVWTVSEEGKWRYGLVNQYFATIEAAADWRLKELTRRIEASNKAGEGGEFGRYVDLKVLRAEVPLHYIFSFSADTLHEAVELGVRRGREWCIENGIPLA
jgi:hypothetical protein